MGWKLMVIKLTLPDKTIGSIGDHSVALTPVDLPSYWEMFQFWTKPWKSSIIFLLPVKNAKMIIFPMAHKNAECHILWIYEH